MFEGIETAALRIWEIRPNFSSLGNFSESLYKRTTASMDFCQTMRSRKECKAKVIRLLGDQKTPNARESDKRTRNAVKNIPGTKTPRKASQPPRSFRALACQIA